jgi:serine/threonine protein phosphatase PrpC
MADGPLIFGRPSPAAEQQGPLRPAGEPALAAYRADGGDAPWVAVRAATVAGVRHRLAGQPGEDSYAWAVGEVCVVAVADGLGGVSGSGPTSARAASAAVGAALEGGVDAGVAAANRASNGGGATTLLLAIVGQDGRVEMARVGDSTAFLVSDGGASWTELFSPADDDGVVTATAALPGPLELERAEVSVSVDDVLVLATDGVADPWRDGPTTVAPALAAALAGRPRPLELIRLADFSRQGCHDDRTLLAAWLVAADDPS